ncbi:MAG: hypothetical protein AYK22_03950 [Thermoplasmatales archaeon SG8-52-3]|nr:MAG: hypothetical protein AYK22_03950 [Thermoplasmatales archaeon SG8-52-3]
MNRLILIIILSILVLSGMSGVATIKNKTNSAPIKDELDQSQTVMIENKLMPIGQILIEGNLINVQVAQSFVPTKDILTRVEVFVGKNASANYPLYISIREELTDNDLTIESVEPAIVPTDELGWVEIDLPDIVITNEHTYYLVIITENKTDNWYAWGANNNSISYPAGCAWFSYDDGDSWTNESSITSSPNSESSFSKQESTRFDEEATWDMCFKTYGKDNLPPEAPVINGPKTARYNESQSYIFTTTDPDDDFVLYQILWGDGTSEEWIGPFQSDELITVEHTWVEQGTYIIAARAKDIYELVGDWTEFEVEIPRNRQLYFNLFRWLFSGFPLIRFIIGQ